MLTIVKPVGNFCNLRCDYCFYNDLDQGRKKLMSFSLLEKLTSSLARLGNQKVVIIWHGGEPLLAGINFYKKAVETQKRYGTVEFENRLQTNAILINKEWIEFFKENNFGIGISLDGIQMAHDVQRPDTFCRPTFSTIIANIELMQSNGLRFGLIQTVTKKSLPFVLDSQWFFYEKLGLRSWNVNFVDEDSCPKGKQLGLSEEDALSMYEQLIEFWSSVEEEVIIDEIDHYVAASLGRRPCSCHYNGRCGNFCCIDYDGTVYPCDRVCSSPQDIWGNLESSELSEIIISGNADSFRQKAIQLH
ncbi:MAG: radical SAM protein, partial [Patescibacteria group bacterium]